MPADPSTSSHQGLSSLLERLCAAQVQFILVGGLAVVAQGVPITTFDIDIVPSPEEVNLRSLLALLLTTDLGPLDLLGKIEGGLGYPELLPNTVEIPYRSHPLRVLKLEAIVQLKRASKREKDRLTLPTLEAALDRQRQKP